MLTDTSGFEAGVAVGSAAAGQGFAAAAGPVCQILEQVVHHTADAVAADNAKTCTKILREVGKVGAAVESVGTAVGQVGTAVGGVNSALGDVGTAVGNNGAALERVGAAVGDVGTAVGVVGAALENDAKQLTMLNIKADYASNELVQLAEGQNKMASRVQILGEESRAAGAAPAPARAQRSRPLAPGTKENLPAWR